LFAPDEVEHLIHAASLGLRALGPERMNGHTTNDSLGAKQPTDQAPKQGVPAIKATPYQWREPHEIKRRAWLYGRHYIRGYVGMTIGRPGLGKTDNAIVEAIDMVTVRKILDPQDRDPLRVWLICEDPREELELRTTAACLVHRIGKEELEGRLFVDSV